MKTYYNTSDPLQPYTLLRKNSNRTCLMQVRDVQEHEGKPLLVLVQLTIPSTNLVSMGARPHVRNRWEDPMLRMQRESERDEYGNLPRRKDLARA